MYDLRGQLHCHSNNGDAKQYLDLKEPDQLHFLNNIHREEASSKPPVIENEKLYNEKFAIRFIELHLAGRSSLQSTHRGIV